MVDSELLSRKISNLSEYINELQRADDINFIDLIRQWSADVSG